MDNSLLLLSRPRIRFALIAAIVGVVLTPTLRAQSQPGLALPGCDAAPEVRKIMTDKLDDNLLDKMKFTERMAYEKKILEDLMARYPRELKPYESYFNLLRQSAPDDFATVRGQWVQQAKAHPDDSLALLLAAMALYNKDTPESIRLLDSARAQAPAFPWPALSLASTYASGRRADIDKTKLNLEAFFALCPGSADSMAQWYLNKDQPFQPKVAAALRARLATETDPKQLEDYQTLWGLEFRTHPPNQHDAVRAQLALDLKRLEAMNPHGDAEWESFLIAGYKQSGATAETVTAMENRLLHDYPHADESWGIVDDRWDKAHPKPTDQTDKAAWTTYNNQFKEFLKASIPNYPDTNFHYDSFYTIYDDKDLAEKEGLAALDGFVDYIRDYQAPRWRGTYYPTAANFLVKHKWQPDRALDLITQAMAAEDKNRRVADENDNLSDDDSKTRTEQHAELDQSDYGIILRAAAQAGKPEDALKFKAAINVPVPTDKKLLAGYWLNRARLEALEKHAQDALTYYQLALTTRTSEPKAYEGVVEDPPKDEARALWNAQGGTETAWAVWSKPQGAATESAEGHWEKPTKTIPDFELSDMSGKTWKLKELNGKTVLINLWATWCGPCQAELPQLEVFYEKNKDRKDIQVLTFDIDEDVGLVAPFLKQKGYTFPVLPAYSTVVSLLDGFAIPQTWLVDQHGVWQWKQIGFNGGSQADFDKEMMLRLNAATGGQ